MKANSSFKLRRLVFLIRKRLNAASVEQMSGTDIDTYAERVAGDILLYIRWYCLGDVREEEHETGVPDGFWQYLRSWLRLPYRRVRINLREFNLLPKLKIYGEDQEIISYKLIESNERHP